MPSPPSTINETMDTYPNLFADKSYGESYFTLDEGPDPARREPLLCRKQRSEIGSDTRINGQQAQS